MIVVGTAGWSIPRAEATAFPGTGTQLERYARVFRGAEINSSFHRPHAVTTYARWASLTPRNFRFAVKLPRTITHDAKLRRARLPLERFLSEVAGLGSRLGPLLVQLPPSLAFETRVARTFFSLLRDRHEGDVVCEPRHESWFGPAAERTLVTFRIARVVADPTDIEAAKRPGGWPELAYYRLHGAPRKYWSRYPVERVDEWARELRGVRPAWCIFDNTAGSGAAANALELKARL
jgi:uncharacterized protein YecE (DUF72 family)